MTYSRWWQRIRIAPGVLWRASAAEWNRLRKTSDVERWSNDNNLYESWRSRTQQLVAHVPSGSTVLEFGCGASRTFELLPESCEYVASDLVGRDPETFICDLNDAPLPVLPEHDVVLMSGVLEYVVDVQRLFRHLEANASTELVLFSYACRVAGQSRITRRQLGWVNDLEDEDILAIGEAGNWHCETIGQWQGHSLYAFRRYQ